MSSIASVAEQSTDHASATRLDRHAYLGLATGWLALVWLINPAAEAPLNDDWAYSLPVQSLVEQGRLQLTFWQSMPLLPQFLWGALFSLPFGFSFTALRISTSVLGLLGVCLSYRALRDRGASIALSMLGALCLMVSPIYLELAHTFMSDVPFVTMLLACSLLFMRALDDERWSLLLGATLCAVIATLVRQVGIVAPLSFAAGLTLRAGWTRQSLPRMVLPLAIVIAALPLSRWWIASQYGLPARYDSRDSGLTAALLDLAHLHLGVLRLPLERLLLLVLHLGLALLPLLGYLALRVPLRQRVGMAVGGLVLAVALAIAGYRFPNPTGGNVLLELAVGPRNLAHAWVVPSDVPRHVITALASLGAAVLVTLLAQRATEGWRQLRARTLPAQTLYLWLLCSIGYGPFLLAYGPHFDRYGLFLVAFAPLLLVEGPMSEPARSRAALTPAWGLIACFGLFSVAAVHDYIAAQRAVWSLARQQERRGPAALIDGAFEYNNYTVQHATFFHAAPRVDDLVDRPHAPYAIDFVSPPGARVIATESTHAVLPYAPTQVVLYARH